MDYDINQLKKAQSVAKGDVTTKANKVNKILTACDDAKSVAKIANELDDVLKQL